MKTTLIGLGMRDDYFCIFIGFMKAGKISGLKEWAELVASQLTQVYLLLQIKLNMRKSVVGE